MYMKNEDFPPCDTFLQHLPAYFNIFHIHIYEYVGSSYTELNEVDYI